MPSSESGQRNGDTSENKGSEHSAESQNGSQTNGQGQGSGQRGAATLPIISMNDVVEERDQDDIGGMGFPNEKK